MLSNVGKLKINPNDIEDIFISHLHWNRIGELTSFLCLNDQVKLWIPSYFSEAENAREFIEVKKPTKLYEGIYSTGELEGIEQSLCVETEKGIVIIAGYSHPRMEYILETASQFGKVYGIIGSLHGNRPEALRNCTQHKSEIKSLYPKKIY